MDHLHTRLDALPVEMLSRIIEVADADSIRTLSWTTKRLRAVALPKVHACLAIKEAWDWNSSSSRLSREVRPYLSQRQLKVLNSRQGGYIPWDDEARQSLLSDDPSDLPEVAALVKELSISIGLDDEAECQAYLAQTSFMYIDHLLSNLSQLRVLHLPVRPEQRTPDSKTFEMLRRHQSLRALCVNTTILSKEEGAALATIGNLEHLRICHSSKKWQTHHSPYTVALLMRNMNTLKSLDILITGPGAENERNRFKLPPGSEEALRFPRLASLALAYATVWHREEQIRPEMASMLSHFNKAIDYSQLSRLSLHLDEEHMAILAAAFTRSLQKSQDDVRVRELSISIRSTAHVDLVSSFRSLTSLHIIFAPAQADWQAILDGIRCHTSLKYLTVYPVQLYHGDDGGTTFTGLEGGVHSIIKSFPLLQRLTLGFLKNWVDLQQLDSIAWSLPDSNLRTFCIERRDRFDIGLYRAYDAVTVLLRHYLTYNGYPSWEEKLDRLEKIKICEVEFAVYLQDPRNPSDIWKEKDSDYSVSCITSDDGSRKIWIKHVATRSSREETQAARLAWFEGACEATRRSERIVSDSWLG